MGKLINLSPEALELVNAICDPDTLSGHIVTLQAAEDTLQEQAYGELDAQEGNNLFTVAYQVKLFRKDLTKLKRIIENGKDD